MSQEEKAWRDSAGIYEGTKPNNLCCSGCEEDPGFLAVPKGSARLDDAYKHTLLFCTAEEAFLAVANSRILPSAAGSRHGNILLRWFVCCEFVVEMPLLFQLAKLRG